MNPSRVPNRTPGVEIGPTRGPKASVTVSAPPDRYFEVSPHTALLLSAINGERTLDELAHLISHGDLGLSAAELEELIKSTLVPRGLVYFGEPPAPAAPSLSRMWLRVPLFPAPVAAALSRPLTWMFRAPVAVAAVAAGLAANVWFHGEKPDFGPPLRAATLVGWLIPLALATFVAIVHELGHAAALLSRGEPPGAIGFGFYWIWPVFFTDVSRAWRLDQRGRLIVDAGGLLIQLACIALLVLWWSRAPSPALARAILLVDVALLTNLNPLFRWAGYWLLSDLTGARNLRQQAFGYLGELLRGQPARPPGWIRLYAFVAAGASVATLAWFFGFVVPKLLGSRTLLSP